MVAAVFAHVFTNTLLQSLVMNFIQHCCYCVPPCPCRNCAVRDTDKAAALLWLLREGLPKKSPTLVFASTRHHVEYLTLLLSLEGVEVCAVHGSMDQVRRVVVGLFLRCRAPGLIP